MSAQGSAVAVDAIPLHRVPTDVVDLLSGAMEVLDGQARSLNVDLVVDRPDGLPMVRIDPEKIAWAVTTLVGNALRYVRTGTRRLPGGTIRVGIERAGAAIAISVDDDGAGIPPETLGKVFAPGGLRHAVGLRLLMVRDVVAAHGGDIEVKSKHSSVEGGTTIVLRIPLA